MQFSCVSRVLRLTLPQAVVVRDVKLDRAAVDAHHALQDGARIAGARELVDVGRNDCRRG